MSKTIVLIPARMASTRLPGKPLADIHGEPMIVHVWHRAREADIGEVVVATDSEAVATAVEKAGGTVTLTFKKKVTTNKKGEPGKRQTRRKESAEKRAARKAG